MSRIDIVCVCVGKGVLMSLLVFVWGPNHEEELEKKSPLNIVQ